VASGNVLLDAQEPAGTVRRRAATHCGSRFGYDPVQALDHQPQSAHPAQSAGQRV